MYRGLNVLEGFLILDGTRLTGFGRLWYYPQARSYGDLCLGVERACGNDNWR